MKMQMLLIMKDSKIEMVMGTYMWIGKHSKSCK